MYSFNNICYSKSCHTVVTALTLQQKKYTSYLSSDFFKTSTQEVSYVSNKGHTAPKDIYIFLAEAYMQSD